MSPRASRRASSVMPADGAACAPVPPPPSPLPSPPNMRWMHLLLAGLAAAFVARETNAGCHARCLEPLWHSTDAALRCHHVCLGGTMLGSLQLAYLLDLKTMLGDGYTRALCGRRPGYPGEGVDVDAHPTGWMRTAEGQYTGCERKTDFPGVGTLSLNLQSDVAARMQQLPRLAAEGRLHRTCALGMLRCSALYWTDVSPQTVGLSMSLQQRRSLRPLLDEVLGECDAACAARLAAVVDGFVGQRGTFRPLEDSIDLMQLVLHEKLFPGEKYPFNPSEFRRNQQLFFENQIPAQMLPELLARRYVSGNVAVLKRYLSHFRRMVDMHFGLAGMDCAPTGDCATQLAHTVLDLFLAPGGLSMPRALTAGLFVLHGNTTRYGDTFPPSGAGPKADMFFWEVLRFFTPVAAFQYSESPDAGDAATQGPLLSLNMAGANKDPNAWGADAHRFRVRAMSDYHTMFTGFADFARDGSVEGGNLNRVCPGKSLALRVGKMFFKHFTYGKWVRDTSTDPRYVDRLPYVEGSFLLRRV